MTSHPRFGLAFFCLRALMVFFLRFLEETCLDPKQVRRRGSMMLSYRLPRFFDFNGNFFFSPAFERMAFRPFLQFLRLSD